MYRARLHDFPRNLIDQILVIGKVLRIHIIIFGVNSLLPSSGLTVLIMKFARVLLCTISLGICLMSRGPKFRIIYFTHEWFSISSVSIYLPSRGPKVQISNYSVLLIRTMKIVFSNVVGFRISREFFKVRFPRKKI